MIRCEICRKEFGLISYTHLKTHDITSKEYRAQFPGIEMVSEEVKEKESVWHKEFYRIYPEKNPSKRPEVKKKHSINLKKNNPMKQLAVRKKVSLSLELFYKENPDVKKERSLAIKGDKNPAKRPEVKKKISLAMTGRKLSLEHKRKIGLGRIGKKHTLETREKISLGNTGKKRNLEVKKKLSIVRKEFCRIHLGWNPMERPEVSAKFEGDGNPMKRLEVRQTSSMTIQGVTDEKDWKGFISFEPYGIEFNESLKEQNRKRDNYRCQECFRHQSELFTKNGKKAHLLIHHIDYNKKNNSPDNLISLCPVCHNQTNFNRDNWTEYYQEELRKRGI